MGAIPPLRYYLEKVLCNMGGISHRAAKPKGMWENPRRAGGVFQALQARHKKENSEKRLKSRSDIFEAFPDFPDFLETLSKLSGAPGLEAQGDFLQTSFLISGPVLSSSPLAGGFAKLTLRRLPQHQWCL